MGNNRETVVDLANAGKKLSEIVSATGLGPQTILSYVRTARSFGMKVEMPPDDMLHRLITESDGIEMTVRLTKILARFGSDFAAARKIGTSESNVAAWRQRKALPSALHLIAICRGCDISARWLLLGEGPMDVWNLGSDRYVA